MFIVDLSYPLTVNRPPSTVVAGFGVLGWSRSPGVDTRELKTENRKPITENRGAESAANRACYFRPQALHTSTA